MVFLHDIGENSTLIDFFHIECRKIKVKTHNNFVM